jgi:uncharacterized membrane protein YfcA
MPVPHHRKKHKHFQPPPRKDQPPKKGSATSIFSITGGVIGLAVGYFATGNLIWAVAGSLIVAMVGYFFGRSIDHSGEKNR